MSILQISLMALLGIFSFIGFLLHGISESEETIV